MNKQKSQCCNATLEVKGNTTKYYVCKACGKPSDPIPDKTQSNPTIDEVLEEIDELDKIMQRHEGVAPYFMIENLILRAYKKGEKHAQSEYQRGRGDAVDYIEKNSQVSDASPDKELGKDLWFHCEEDVLLQARNK